MRFVSIVGARPQFIKLAPVSRALRRWHEEVIVHTGQHYDPLLSAAFFAELDIPAPTYQLAVGSGSHGAQTGRMLSAIEEVLLREQKHLDGVIVYGDTNSTLAGALAAAKLGIPVAHVEAGLRSYNRAMPEEINRVIADHLATRLFCPTENARLQAAHEGLTRGVEVVGDVAYDLLRQMQPGLAEHARQLLPSLDLTPGGYVLATVHRPANTDDPTALGSIAAALNHLGLPVVLPLHPRTRQLASRHRIVWGEQVRVVEPLGYRDLLTLLQYALQVVTDSGGVQKEAFLLGTPCVTLREETEWPETLEGGWNVLVGNRRAAIIEAVQRRAPTPLARNPFGEGDAAQRIAASLKSWPDPA